MIARIFRTSPLAIPLLVLCAGAACAAELDIPVGYFNASGGFYGQGVADCGCLRYAPAGGCTISLNFPPTAPYVYPDAQSESATFSWYAGQVPPSRYAPRGGCPSCEPAAAEFESAPALEDIGPGLP